MATGPATGFQRVGYPGFGGTGGGIYSSGVLTLTDSTIHGNRAGDGGGGVGDWTGGSGGSCGGLDSTGPSTLRNSTISDNRPGSGGQNYEGLTGPDGDFGGICADSPATIGNTIIADSAPPSVHDCTGQVHSQGYNLVEAAGTCPFSATGDLTGTDPLLGPLADNGGDTFTQALLPDSPAVDQGRCPAANADQRGQPRPVDVPAVANADDGCDAGAYEYQAQPLDLWLNKTGDNPVPDAGPRISYPIVLKNVGLSTLTHALVSDTMPTGLAFIGPATLDPPDAGGTGDPPHLASELTIPTGRHVTLHFPARVNAGLLPGTVITNTAAVTSSEMAVPRTCAVPITTRYRQCLPLVFRR